MVRINGKDVDAAGVSLTAYLAGEGLRPECIAVERNNAIVKRSTYDDVIFADGDVIEIVHFVGGG